MISFIKSLTLTGRLVMLVAMLAVLVGGYSLVRDFFIGNTEVIADIETGRAGAAVENAKEVFDDLADLDEIREENLGVVEATERAIAAAETQAEKDAIAEAALCQLDPAYCPEEE